jgi:ABC-type phosphate transport system permease subunit
MSDSHQDGGTTGVASALVGTVAATAAAAVIAVPFVGFMPLIVYCGGLAVFALGVKVLDELLPEQDEE